MGFRLKNLQEKPGVVNQPFLWSPVFDPYVLEKGIFGKDDWKTVWLLSNVENNPGDHFSVGSCGRVLGLYRGQILRSGFGKGFIKPADLRKHHQVPAPFLSFFVAKPHFRVPPFLGTPQVLPWVQLWILSWETTNLLKWDIWGGPVFRWTPVLLSTFQPSPGERGAFFASANFPMTCWPAAISSVGVSPEFGRTPTALRPRILRCTTWGNGGGFKQVCYFYPKTWGRWPNFFGQAYI